MAKKHLFLKIGLAVIGALSVVTPIFAEEPTTDEFVWFEEAENLPTIDRETGRLTVRYFDDSEETAPVTGAEFTIYKVADIGRSQVEGTNGKYLPLTEDLDFVNETDALAYEEKVISAYEAGLGKNGGYTATVAVNEEGEAVFDDLPVGAYLVTETKVMRYHVRSTPFLESVPETNESGTSWNFDVVCNPKQILAGDLNVTKKIKGKDINKDTTYHIKLTLNTEGTFKAKMPDGTEGTVKDGDEIAIKANQTLYIYDIPANTEYFVTEVEENGNDASGRRFDTTYKNQDGKIKDYSGILVTITNDSTNHDDGAGFKDAIIFGLIGATAMTTLCILFATRKKDKKQGA